MSEKERAHFKIALPVDLKKQLEHAAVDHRRSLSAEIIARLEASFSPPALPADLDQVIERIVNRVVFGNETAPPISPVAQALIGNKILGPKGED